MSSSLNIFSEILQLVWPLIAIFTLVICLRAKQRHPGQGSTLMVAGAAITLLVTVVNTSMNFAMRYNWLDYDSIGMNYAFTNVISIVGRVLFLVGLLTLINSITTVEEKPLSRY